MMMSSANGPVTSLRGKTPSVGRSTGLAKLNLFVFICSLLRQNVYGFLDEEDAEEEEHGFSYKQMEARDQRRWSMADLDHSGELDIQVPNTSLRYFLPAMLTKMSFQEFAAFLHPEDAEHMRDIVVQETLEDIDKDGDGHVRIPIKKFSS